MNKIIQHLLNLSSNAPQTQLWCLDESGESALASLQSRAEIQVLTNRFDIHEKATAMGIQTLFNDWRLSDLPSYDLIVLPTAKEKSVMHHLINQSFYHLTPKGRLLLAGEKHQGAKSYIEKACKYFQVSRKIQKDGQVYSSEIVRGSDTPGDPLDDNQYTELVEVSVTRDYDSLTFWSKPGVFGWNKIDQGSALLVDVFKGDFSPNDATGRTLLDLGCGYGYLTHRTLDFPFEKRIATDNNAGALICAQKNLGESIDVMASDCGDTVQDKIDVILCNPPFHQGFDLNSDLGKKFLSQTNRLLRDKHAVAYFVVNSFIGIEKAAESYFERVECLENNKQFKVLKLGQKLKA